MDAQRFSFYLPGFDVQCCMAYLDDGRVCRAVAVAFDTVDGLPVCEACMARITLRYAKLHAVYMLSPSKSHTRRLL